VPATQPTRSKLLKEVQMLLTKFTTLLVVVGTIIRLSPASGQTFTTYHCRDGAEFVIAFFEHDRRAHLQLDGKALTLPKRPSLSGSRYAKGNITMRITKTVTTLKRGKRSTVCTAVR
jgi:membrane-bound inhibitor of C-type lysozyme